MEARWRIQLLGELRVVGADRRITRFQTHKTGALLAYLAFHDQRRHPREVLIELLWPEDELDRARHKLRMALSSLRRQLEPPGVPAGSVLEADRASVGLNPLACGTDVGEFEETLARVARSRSSIESEQLWRTAAELYGGELLPGFYEEWITPERERLTEAYRQTLRRLIGHREEARDFDGALLYARRALAVDLLREEAHRDLMRLHALAGRHSEALQQYRELERLLRDDLDASPSPATRRLAQEIQAAAASRTAAPVPDPTRRNTPLSPSPANAAVTSRNPPCVAPSAKTGVRSRAKGLTPGTVTFLVAESEGVSVDAQPAGDDTASAHGNPIASLQDVCSRHRGRILEGREGVLMASFGRATDAVACAIAAQRADGGLRMALNTGEAAIESGHERSGGGCPALQTAIALLPAGHAGQILCSEATAALLRGERAATGFAVGLRALGTYRLPNGSARRVTPQRLYQVLAPGLPEREFPPPKAERLCPASLPRPLTRFFGREDEIAQLEELLLGSPAFSHHGDTETRREHAAVRLVTLTGPGGCGKTRLALEVASRLLERYRGAVWFVPLADLTDPARIADATMAALALPCDPGTDSEAQAVRALSREPCLLVLDNLEHLLPGGTTVIQRWLQQAPSLTCLVTSRQRLRLSGEREFPIAPLPTPVSGIQAFRRSGVQESTRDSDSTPDLKARTPERLNAFSPERLMHLAAVRLFVDRAQAVRPDFQVTRANAAAVAELCRRLEGIPLALELAAARIGALSPAQMVAHLARRFDLLVSRQRDTPPRHSTLRAAIDASYELLAPETQRFFARLAVFRGGFSLEAAEEVCLGAGCWVLGLGGLAAPSTQHPAPSALERLEELRECSLIVAEESGDAIRYRLLETLREYAWEKLAASGAEQDLRARHRSWCLRLAEEAERALQSGEQKDWLDRLEAEHDNLRAALAWSLAEGARPWALGLRSDGAFPRPNAQGLTPSREVGLRLAGALWRFWWARGYWSEGRSWLRALLELPGDREGHHLLAARAKALGGAGLLAFHQSDYEPARVLLEESFALWQELEQAGATGRCDGNPHETNASSDREEIAGFLQGASLAPWREPGNPGGAIACLNLLGLIASRQDDTERARSCFEESLARSRQRGHTDGIAEALRYLGTLALDQGECRESRDLLEAALATARTGGIARQISRCLNTLGGTLMRQGEVAAAHAAYEESLEIERALGEPRGIAHALGYVGRSTASLGDLGRACALQEESLALWRQFNERSYICWALINLALTLRARGDYDRAQTLFQEHLTLRRELGDQHGVASGLRYLGWVETRRGDLEAARGFHGECLALYRKLDIPSEVAWSLWELGFIAHARGEQQEARARLRESLTLSQSVGNRESIAECFLGLALVAAGEQEYRRAAHLLGAAQALLAAIGTNRFFDRSGSDQRCAAAIRAALGEAHYAALNAEGRALSVEEILASEQAGGELAVVKEELPDFRPGGAPGR